MSSKTMKNAMAVGVAAVLGVAGAFAVAAASPSWAAATLPNAAAVKTAASIQVTDVRYYRRVALATTVAGITVVGIMAVATTIPVQRRPPGSRSASLGPRQGRRRRHIITGRLATTRHMATMVTRLIRPTLILKAMGGVDI